MSEGSKWNGPSSIISSHKRKRATLNEPSLEIDLEAPEPVSKKKLRKAKKSQTPKSRKNALNSEGLKEVVSSHEQGRASQVPGGRASPIKRSGHGIWVGNLPFFITKKDLQDFFSKSIGETTNSAPLLTRVHLPRAPAKHGVSQNRGFAYVDFQTAAMSQNALSLNESLLGGRRMLIKGAGDFQGRPTNQHTTSIPPSKRLFVGNLAFDITREALQHHFEKCGPVSNVHIATFEDSGKCKGYAWVSFENLESAEKAMRGYLDSNEVGHEASEEDSLMRNTKQETAEPGTHRIWVNRLASRKLRLEFAEDPATRYAKRFGKEAQEKEFNTRKSSIDEVSAQTPFKQRGNDEKGGSKRKEDTMIASSHPHETVHRLNDSIVRSQGIRTKLE